MSGWGRVAARDKVANASSAAIAAIIGVSLAVTASASPSLHSLTFAPDVNGHIVLVWGSPPGECYEVYTAEALADGTVWRIAAARVPSGGDAAAWRDESTESQVDGVSLPCKLEIETWGTTLRLYLKQWTGRSEETNHGKQALGNHRLG